MAPVAVNFSVSFGTVNARAFFFEPASVLAEELQLGLAGRRIGLAVP